MNRTSGTRVHGASSRTRLCGTALLAALLASTSGHPRAWAQEKEKLPKGEEILDKSIDAMGGKEAFEKLKSRVSKGTFEMPGMGVKGSFAAYEAAPSKQYILVEAEGLGKIESGYDGQVCWELSAMRGPRLLEGEEKALTIRQAAFNGPMYWRKLYKKAECLGAEEVDGRPCFKVEMTPNEGGPEIEYYDQKSYLLVKSTMTLKGETGNIPLETFLSEYKKIDGILFPHKTVQRALSMEQVVTLETVQHNVDLPADRFTLPEPVQALVDKGKAESKPASQPEKPKNEEPGKDKPKKGKP